MESLKAIKPKILVVVEEPPLQEKLSLILLGEGYNVQVYSRGEDFLKDVGSESFDLIITEFSSPNINGLELCRTLRETFLLRYTPLIMLLKKGSAVDKAKIIYGGADDYIDNPESSEEILLKVKAALWRAYRYQDISPLTHLPSISTTMRELKTKIEAQDPFAVGYAELFQFRRFNERYGFRRGDEVLIHTAELLRKTIMEFGSPYDFLSHFGGDDFVFITLPESVEDICTNATEEFDRSILSFYDDDDRQRGCIYLKNRRGELCSYPIMKMSIGVVTNEFYPLTSAGQIIQVITELKNYAKKFEKSTWVKERRKTFPFS